MADGSERRPVIVVEFNELSSRLMEQFIGEGVLPNFKRLRDQSVVCLTDAEEEPPALEPWIQWVTVHTGKSYAEHKVFEHTDGAKYKGGRIWDMMSDAGQPVWICGSMNSAVRGGAIKGYVLPDPWAEGVSPMPAGEFEGYHHFVSTYVKEHAAEKVSLKPADYLRFGWFMATHGLSPRTVTTAVRQLLSERRKDVKWARALIMDHLQLDVFKHYWRKTKPQFSTFFLNSTAHFQHFHWREMEPDLFQVKPTKKAEATYAEAIRTGYRNMDGLLGEILDMAGKDVTIVFATGLSQQAMTNYEETGGKLLYKPHDPSWLAAYAGVKAPFAVLPAMSNQYYFAFENAEVAAREAETLSKLGLSDGRPLLFARQNEEKVSITTVARSLVNEEVTLRSPVSNETPRFVDIFFPIGLRSGWHHPEGMFWVRAAGQAPRTVSRKLSLRELAPTLLALCGVEKPAGESFDFPPVPEVVLGASQMKVAA